MNFLKIFLFSVLVLSLSQSFARKKMDHPDMAKYQAWEQERMQAAKKRQKEFFPKKEAAEETLRQTLVKEEETYLQRKDDIRQAETKARNQMASKYKFEMTMGLAGLFYSPMLGGGSSLASALEESFKLEKLYRKSYFDLKQAFEKRKIYFRRAHYTEMQKVFNADYKPVAPPQFATKQVQDMANQSYASQLFEVAKSELNKKYELAKEELKLQMEELEFTEKEKIEESTNAQMISSFKNLPPPSESSKRDPAQGPAASPLMAEFMKFSQIRENEKKAMEQKFREQRRFKEKNLEADKLAEEKQAKNKIKAQVFGA